MIEGIILTPDIFVVAYPFVRERVAAHWLADDNGVPEIDHWRPGVYRIGKKRAGNLLDGVQHLAFPTTATGGQP